VGNHVHLHEGTTRRRPVLRGVESNTRVHLLALGHAVQRCRLMRVPKVARNSQEAGESRTLPIHRSKAVGTCADQTVHVMAV
jgi:hypothetical protein